MTRQHKPTRSRPGAARVRRVSPRVLAGPGRSRVQDTPADLACLIFFGQSA